MKNYEMKKKKKMNKYEQFDNIKYYENSTTSTTTNKPILLHHQSPKKCIFIFLIIFIILLLFIGGSIFIIITIIIRYINQGTGIYGEYIIPSKVLSLPRSKNHSPDSSWWGYNMMKITRYNDIVYFFVVENDDNPITYSVMRIYKIGNDDDGRIEKGVGFNCTRPGNIFVDSKGILHVIVFEATDIIVHDSIGKAVHYYFTTPGDIINYEQEIAVEHGKVNIRLGASIGKNGVDDDVLVIAFGHYDSIHKQCVQLLYKNLDDINGDWNHYYVSSDINHNLFYDYVILLDNAEFAILTVQDDQAGMGESNFYLYSVYFESKLINDKRIWFNDTVVDYRDNPEAQTNHVLVECSDLYQDITGRIHIIVKGYGTNKTLYHFIKQPGESGWSVKEKIPNTNGIRWCRMFEMDSHLFYFCSTSQSYLIYKDSNWNEFISIRYTNETFYQSQIHGSYLYISSKKSNLDANPNYLDVYSISGYKSDYSNENGVSLYFRIDKKEILKQFGLKYKWV